MDQSTQGVEVTVERVPSTDYESLYCAPALATGIQLFRRLLRLGRVMRTAPIVEGNDTSTFVMDYQYCVLTDIPLTMLVRTQEQH